MTEHMEHKQEPEPAAQSQPQEEKVVLPADQSGKIKWFDDVKGYGFILSADNREVFVHRKYIEGFKSGIVEEHDSVTYALQPGEKFQARNVTVANYLDKRRYFNASKRYFRDAQEKRERVTVKMLGKRTAEGLIKRVEPYAVGLEINPGEELEISKLDIKYIYANRYADLVQNRVRVEQSIRSLNLKPAEKVQDRFKVTWEALHQFRMTRTRLICYLLEGESFLGSITWFNKYLIGFTLAPRKEIVIFRHAIFNYKVFEVPRQNNRPPFKRRDGGGPRYNEPR